MLLQILLLFGLLGAILMFVGDMTLYYSKSEYVSGTDASLKLLVDIMKGESRTRLYAGGIIGPMAALLYCIGYYHLVLFMDEKYVIAGWSCFFINCLGIIFGGAYHSHCAYYGLIGRLENEEALNEVSKYLNVQKLFVFGLQGIGFLALAVFIVAGWTVLPRWMILLSPGILFLFAPLTRKLPKGLHIVIGGGWTNLISVIYYTATLIITFN